MWDDIKKRSRGYLPHWERDCGTYFVTYRLADSLPQSFVEKVEFERRDILRTAEQLGRGLTSFELKQLSDLFSERIDRKLDSGSGECHLVDPRVAGVVVETLRKFDGVRYTLLAWCVMPNHVHVVAQMFPGFTLAAVLHTWKSFTASKANQTLARKGQFWQREYYDHLVRDERDLDRVARYVAENPLRAGLRGWKWVWMKS